MSGAEFSNASFVLASTSPYFDPDAPLSLVQMAPYVGRSVHTLRHWTKSATTFDRYRLSILLAKDQSGRWISTPRRIAKWRDAVIQEVSNGI